MAAHRRGLGGFPGGGRTGGPYGAPPGTEHWLIAGLAVETGIPVQQLVLTDDFMIQTMRRYIVERRAGGGL